MEIHGEGFLAIGMLLVLEEGENREVVVFLGGGEVLEGHLVDDTGTPVAEAAIRVVPRNRTGKAGEWADRRETLSDPRGRFHFEGLPAGSLLLDVLGKGVGLDDHPVEAPSRDLKIVAPRMGGFRIRIVRPESEEGPFNLDCDLGHRSGGDRSTASFGGGRTGTISREGLQGRVTFAGRVRGFAPVLRSFEIVPGTVLDLGDVRLVRGEEVKGVICDDLGRPAEGLRVVLRDPATDLVAGATFADAEGRFLLERVPDIPLVAAVEDGVLRVFEAPIEPGRGLAPLAWTVDRTSTLEVEVIDQDGRPVPGVEVLVLDPGDREVPRPYPTSDRTGKDGRNLSHVPPGLLRVRLSRNGHVVEAGRIPVGSGEWKSVRLAFSTGGK